MNSLFRTIFHCLVSFALFASVSAIADEDAKAKVENDGPKIHKEIKVDLKSDGAPVEIIVPVAFFMTFPACMFLFFLFKYRSTKEKQITLRAMVENGAQIPPEMFMDGKRMLKPIDRDRKNGIIYTLGSLGLIAFLLILKTGQPGLWSIGLIPLLTGVGYLINWKMAEAKTNNQ
ncbi:MAG: DUF6249 domain-containing protein [Halobacteriovoraceae bacterium]|nr:DUF6249 domain-containing protein [Halobacteriovoraceae bacterium]